MFPHAEMCNDAPGQPGRRRLTGGENAVRAGLAVVIIMIFLERTAGAQSGADATVAIPVHPNVTTTLYFPDEIERVRFTAEIGGLIGAVKADDMLLIRPRTGIPVGEEVTVAVWTKTLRWRFRLRVVRRARDASREIAVVAVQPEPREPVPDRDRATSSAPSAGAPVPAGPAAPASTVPPGSPAEPSTAEPATPAVPASAAAGPPRPAAEPSVPEPAESAGPVTTRPERTAAAGDARDAVEAAADDERTVALPGVPRFELSMQGVVTLAGTTQLDIAGYYPTGARRSHRAFSVRMAAALPGRLWAVEANAGGEWLAAPTKHTDAELVVMSGPWLRVDAGVRARVPTRWSPTLYGGAGLQAHYRDIDSVSPQERLQQRLAFGGVLALGLGLAYRTDDLMLGVELHIRQGVPDTYRSVGVFLSAGFFLDRGE